MEHYKVGDWVWWARCGNKRLEKPCPICFGKKEVTLILGNDERVVLPCQYCGGLYNPPTGIIVEHEYIAEPEQMEIAEVRIRSDQQGSEISYLTPEHYILYPDVVFDTEEEARNKCKGIGTRLQKEQRERADHLKHSQRKSYSWNAGYHLREAARSRKDAKRHEEKAKLCKERAR